MAAPNPWIRLIKPSVPSGIDPVWSAVNDHAWRYFELHAGQRLSVFNFFTIAAGIVLAGMAALVKGSPGLSLFGAVLGIVLALLSFVFWKLDQRASFLVKHAEGVIRLAEAQLLPEAARTMTNEPSATLATRRGRGPVVATWTFGAAFRTLFSATALVGVVAALLFGLRATGRLEWGTGEDHAPEVRLECSPTPRLNGLLSCRRVARNDVARDD